MSCPALLNGVLLNLERSLFQDIYADVYGIDADVWRRDLDEMCQAGLKKVMLFTGIPFAVKTPGRASNDMLDFIYRECALRGMEVIIATGGTRTGLSNLLLSQKRQNLSRNTLTCFLAATVTILLLQVGTLTMNSVYFMAIWVAV